MRLRVQFPDGFKALEGFGLRVGGSVVGFEHTIRRPNLGTLVAIFGFSGRSARIGIQACPLGISGWIGSYMELVKVSLGRWLVQHERNSREGNQQRRVIHCP